MLQQVMRVSWRGVSPAIKWVEPVAEVKTLDQMPGPSAVRFIWDLLANRGLSRLHELQLDGRRRFGPMWKASFGPVLTVHVAEPELIEQVLRQEGHTPMRSDISSWKDYRKHRGHGYGLLTAEGEEWQNVRSLLAKHMLRPKSVEAYDSTLNAVVTDLITKLTLRKQQNPHGVISDIAAEFYRFGLEGISSVLFESRIGCLDAVVPVETERFIQSINTMFVMTLLTMAMPAWLHRLFPKPWRTFCQCWDYMFQFAKGHIDQRLKEEEEKLERGQEVEGRYLTYFLSRAGMPMKSVYSNVTELLLAGVDTISSTLSWSLYELSRHPEIQESLRSEVMKVLGDRRIPTAADVAAMPLMKAVIKEITRLYPVIPANARVITDRNITVGGYIIPKKTLITLCHYATSRDPAQFSNPNSFFPQRWISRDEGNHPYSSVPFGVGKRSCIGRRIAELELYLALSRILLHFEVKPDPSGHEVRPMTRTLLVPDREMNLQFIER
ncbi:25-hydroxyvitamin D-1 alpha hydroxylase, mitochondrial [Pangasianodon hypophthalmus]|uniref:25-hydroxyvitamin D-1 alpha hydroxylase, mitochondrial n=1 Tax=Pangasianodon hypophthalmus TaxID=310915 RepID=UPI00230784F4|nr:25-hydroxyvitamin D-1 alpha hydroxylase, mitochondrial [Pangasianodon hypophthalmus]